MPDRATIILYAMYVIGEVESGHDWAAVNRNDPFTVGMMQWYGQRAAGLCLKCKAEDAEGWETFAASAPTLAAAIEAGHDWNWWTGYYLNDAEANAWQTWAQRDGNHAGQESQWSEDAGGYIDTLTGWGCSESYPKTLIYAMSMYHQSPAQAGRVISSCGGTATLDNMHATCLNDSVLGQYRNRYNTVYDMLNAWDGESAPPDFGQSGEIGAGDGGQAPGIDQPSAVVSRVEVNNGIVTIYGEGVYQNGVVCYKSAPNVWTPSITKSGESNPGGNTGGGSQTGTEAQNAICEFLTERIGRYAYSQGAGRLSPDTSGYTDCSALMWYAYQQVTGLEIGTWTGAQVGQGTEIARGSGALPLDSMQPADLVFFNWSGYNPSYDHVEAYLGNGQLIGHGGPGNGPTVKEDANAYASAASDWQVRRYL